MREMHDSEGNLRQFMLSEFIELAKQALATGGDMPVWVSCNVLEYDDTRTIDSPAVDVRVMRPKGGWWPGDDQKLAFVVYCDTV